jgi:hypothetical protein
MIRNIAWGLIIMAIGGWVWLARQNPEFIRGPLFRRDWPLIIVAAGVMTAVEGIAWSVRRRQ